MFLKTWPLLLAILLAARFSAHGQDAISSIEQSRLFTTPPAPGTTVGGTPEESSNGVPNADSDDDSFGTQIILKNQERQRAFSVFGDTTTFYTSNVDLTPDHERGDVFLAADAGAAWRPILSRSLVGEVSLAISTLRYDKASELNFERLSIGNGVTWVVPHAGGIIAYARYDFSEVWDDHGSQLLQDHAFTLGGQRTFVFGRSHSLTAGLTGVLGISDPTAQQRNQAAIHGIYHLQVTQSVGLDLLYRYAGQFYAEDGRIDRNQTASLTLGYAINRWLRADLSISGARNDSNRGRDSYQVLDLGGAVRVGIRF